MYTRCPYTMLPNRRQVSIEFNWDINAVTTLVDRMHCIRLTFEDGISHYIPITIMWQCRTILLYTLHTAVLFCTIIRTSFIHLLIYVYTYLLDITNDTNNY